MGDINKQNPTQPMQASDWRSQINPKAREKIVAKIVATLSKHSTQPEILRECERIGRTFEEKVFTIATDQKDYLKKISIKMMSLEGRGLHPGGNASVPVSIPLHSAPMNVQQTNQQTNHNQLLLQSAGSPQPQLRQIIQSNTPMSRGVVATPSSSVAAISGEQQRQQLQQNVHKNVDRIQSQSASVHMSNEGSGITHRQQVPTNLGQPIARQKHVSFQRDVTPQRRFLAPQQKLLPDNVKQQSIGLQSNSANYQQNHSPQGKPPDTLQPQQHLLQSNRMPVVVRSDRLGGQQPSCGFPSQRSHEKINSQHQPSGVRVAMKPNSCVTSESQNLLRSERGTTESGNAPVEVCKTREVPSSAEKHADAWREEIHQRIIIMRNRYMSTVEEMHRVCSAKLKQLNLQPELPNRDKFERLKDTNNMLVRMLRVLTIPKEKLVPGHKDGLDVWEKQIVLLLKRMCKNAAPSLQQGQDPRHDNQSFSQLPPQAHSAQALPVEEQGENKTRIEQVRLPALQSAQRQRLLPQQQPVSLQAHQLTNELGKMKGDLAGGSSHPLKDTQKTIPSTPSLPTPNHRPEAPQRPATLPLVKRKRDMECNDSSKLVSVISPSLSESHNLSQDHGNSPNILCDRTSVTQSPIQRLVNIVGSISSHALKSSVDDIFSVASMIDGMDASIPGVGSKSALGQDLMGTTRCRMQARNFNLQEGQRERCICPVPIEMWNDQEKNPVLEKQPTIENAADKLLEEIKAVNQRLIDTVVEICEEDINCRGTVVKCYFSGVSVNSFIKSVGLSGCSSVIQPLRLLVPTGYPDCSPEVLDKLPGEVGDECIDLSDKAKSRLGLSLRSLEDPISLGEIARTWDFCARAVITEYAEKYGGGTFSSRYGAWENCLGAA